MPHKLLDAATPADSRETEQFIALVADKLAATDRLFRECLASDVPFIQKSGEYIFDGGGKRMRPALLLLCARLLDRDGEEEVTYAAVVELIHTATLIHDDIIDHSALRRGRQTINELWGNNLTVLLGDWLYTTAMKMALRHGSVAILDRLCDATLRMTEGELLTQERLGAIDLTVAEYFEIIDRKTAQLFAAACSLPARIQPVRRGGDRAARALRSRARHLLPARRRPARLHRHASGARQARALRPQGGQAHPPPAPSAAPHLAAGARQDRARSRRTGLRHASRSEEISRSWRAKARSRKWRVEARRWAEAARQALALFPDSAARRALEFAPDFVLHRRA